MSVSECVHVYSSVCGRGVGKMDAWGWEGGRVDGFVWVGGWGG